MASKQEELICKLRSRIEDLTQVEPNLKEDFYLLQWLKARKMKLDATATAIRNAVKWRLENGVYEMAKKETWSTIEKYNIAIDLEIEDKQGVKVIYGPMGAWDVRSYIEDCGRQAFVRYMTLGLIFGEQQMIEASRKLNAGKPPGSQVESTGFTLICNGAGYSFRQARSVQTILAAMECARIYENYFPQNCHTVYFINVGSLFSKILKMMQPFMGVTKLEIFGERETWIPALRKIIDPAQLSPDLGGTKMSKEGQNQNGLPEEGS